MRTSGGRRNRAGTLGETVLVALGVRGFIGARDVRRKRNMPEPLKMLADAALVMRNEAKRAQAKRAARAHLGLQFSFAEKNPFPELHLATGPNKRLPSLGINLTSKEDFDFPGQMLGSRGARWRLRTDASTPREQACGDDARVVEDQEFVASQETGEFREESVFEDS